MRSAPILAALFVFLRTPVTSAGTTESAPVQDAGISLSTHAATTPHLNYYGGPIVANVKVVSVFWGSGVNSTIKSNMSTFFSAVTSSNWMDMLPEYSTAGVVPAGGGIGSNQTIGHGTSAGAYTISPSNTATTIDDSAIQIELNAQLTGGHLPANDANTAYVIFFPPGITVTYSGGSSCAQFCEYHSTIAGSPNNIRYGVMPDFYPPGACALGCGSGATVFDNVTMLSSHMLAEIVTDPDVGLSSSYGPPLGWYDPQGSDGEIGDICNGQGSTFTSGTGQTWTVQKLWSNWEGACTSIAATDYTTLSTACPTTFVENQAITLTATVSRSSPGGNVTFQDGSNVFCSNVALTSGSANCQTPALTVLGTGTSYVYLPTGNYSGDGANTPSVSAPLALTVLSATDVVFRNGLELNLAGCPTK